MVLILKPAAGSIVKNFQIINEGGSYDDVKCLIKQGTWSSGRLDSNVPGKVGYICNVTDYLNSTVNIKVGTYSADKANGTISEYTFPKTSWDLFITNPVGGIDSTKSINVYVNGVLSSTTSTDPQKIKGAVTRNGSGYIDSLVITEV